VANYHRKAAANATVGMALGQAVLTFGLSVAAALSEPSNLSDHRLLVLVPLWFAPVPLLTGLGLLLHVRLCTHEDETCPWIGLAWTLMALNLAALCVFIFHLE